jgi:hypothetical protein
MWVKASVYQNLELKIWNNQYLENLKSRKSKSRKLKFRKMILKRFQCNGSMAEIGTKTEPSKYSGPSGRFFMIVKAIRTGRF